MHGRNNPLPPVVRELAPDCAFTENGPDGRVRHKLRGRVLKGRKLSGEEAEWVVLDIVHQAAALLTAVNDDPTHLFGHKGMTSNSLVLFGSVNKRLNDFRDHLNELFSTPDARYVPLHTDAPAPDNDTPAHDEPEGEEEPVPWRLSTRQYQHAELALFEGYAGTSASGFAAEVAAERAIAQLDYVEDLYRDWNDGMADPTVSYRDETGHFVRWSVQHRHARDLTYGTVRWTGPLSTIDSEKRWADARRLLNDDTLPTLDRVAGLLLILYAQKIATISQLTVDDVHFDGDTVSITFGTSPVVLPAPMASLVHELVATRRGKAKIGTPEDVPWLFPGGHPGRPLTDSQIGIRLHKIGIRPKQDRSTALFTLATELPAAILARMLGVHIKVAVQWQKASAGDWAAYAADVSQRSRREITEVNEGFQPPDSSPSGTSGRGC